jgi:hypothetical protein
VWSHGLALFCFPQRWHGFVLQSLGSVLQRQAQHQHGIVSQRPGNV